MIAFLRGQLRVLCLFALVFTATTHAADFEPRYWWTATGVSPQQFATTDEAFQVYKAWEDNNNLTRPGTANDITVIGYELVGQPGQGYWLINNLPGGYSFRFIRPSDCPNSCLGNSMTLITECPVGTTSVQTGPSGGAFKRYCVEPATKREPDLNSCPGCDSINPSNGMKRETETDYDAGPRNLRFTRTYRSDRNGWRTNYDFSAAQMSSALGTSTSQSRACRPNIGLSSPQPYCFRYVSQTQANDFVVERDNGHVVHLDSVTGTSGSADVKDRVTRVNDGGGVLMAWDFYDSADDSTKRFDLAGRLQTITYRDGRIQTLSYSNGTTPGSIAPAPGLLINVTDHAGKQLAFTYDAQSRLQTMTDPDGQVYTYAYDEASSIVVSGAVAVGNLTSVTYPDLTQRVYWYNEQDKTASTNLPFALTGITDESGARYAIFKYDSSGRGVSTEHAGVTNKTALSYSGSTATVTEPLGVSRTHGHSALLGTSRLTNVSGARSVGGVEFAGRTYDANVNIASRVDFNGNKICYAYDLTRNLETVRVEGFATGISCPANLVTYTPTAGTRQRKISTQWHSTFRIPTQIDEPGKRTTFTHDANGNVLTKTVLDTSTTASRTWTYTYNSVGQVLTADGPRTDVSDVTTYTYYNCTTGDECRQVETVTNALGHVTTYDTYNAHGRPLTITDPNGVVTTLTYDLRQRLTSRTVGTEQTTFDYWPTGPLKKVTLPDSSFLELTYDAAHRLTEIEDSEGNRTVYTLDAAGNRTAEELYDPSSALTQTRTRVFNTLNQLWKEIGAAGTAAVTTIHTYDNNGNETGINAPLSRNSIQAYDELNRLKQITDPLSGVTQYGYDALDQLISVTDPRSKVTSYAYNALSDLGQQVSPDTGTTANTYDSGGNLATSTDARSKTGTYAYDALNRVTSVTYPDQTISYTYDSGTNQKGRLTQVTDASGSTSWSYDTQGRVLSRQQSMGVSKTLGYAYDSFGRLQTLTLPSGNTITYGYTDGKVTSLTLNGSTTILSNVLYQPFGRTRGWTWGNSTLAIREYDTDGKISDIDSAGLKTYSYDDAFRITGITDAVISSLSQTYGYDLLDRLTSAAGTSLSQGWTYDPNGNRLSQTGSAASTYTVSSTSNRLNTVSGALTRTYGYDNSGNATADGTATFTYNDAGRMVSATKAGVTTTYALNALGQRVKKNTSGTSTYFVYDEAGHLVGEYNNSGNLIQETAWIGDIPVATLRSTGGGDDLFYVHTDHLNTPKQISRPSDNVVVWRWDSNPFGSTSANEDPDGDLNPLVYGLRFPGQYLDSETGLHYNYFRDGYDSSIGRYTQSDPIGIDGGLNTYLYADANPFSNIDPTGEDAIAVPLPRPVPVPGWAGPAGAVAGAGWAGWQIGSAVYPHISEPLGDLIDKVCPPACNPPKGTVCFMIDIVPPSKPHYPIPGSHYHLWQMNQTPSGQCFWNKLEASRSAPPGAIPCPFTRPSR